MNTFKKTSFIITLVSIITVMAVALIYNELTKQKKEIKPEQKQPKKEIKQIKQIRHQRQKENVKEFLKKNKTQNKANFKELTQTAQKNPDPLMREASILGLSKYPFEETKEILYQGLKDEKGSVRMRSALALVKHNDSNGVVHALKELNEGDQTGKYLATQVLTQNPDPKTLTKLKEFQNHENSWTRINAKKAETIITYKLTPMDKKINYLKNTLSHPQFEIRKWAAFELKAIVKENRELKQQAQTLMSEIIKTEHISKHMIQKILVNLRQT